MFLVELSAILGRLNPHCYRAFEEAAVFANSRRHHEVEIEHLIFKLLEDAQSDIPQIFAASHLSFSPVQRGLRSALDSKPTDADDRPEFSPYLAQLLQDAWLIASLEQQLGQLRSGQILLALLQQPARYKVEGRPGIIELLRLLSHKVVRGRFDELLAASHEVAAPPGAVVSEAARDAPDSSLVKFTYDVTADARGGKLDEVSGRDAEIDQLISILSRRRKNNPLIVGEAGVGKTALVEGLALRIAKGEVFGWLRDVTIRSLDLGLLQAGAGLKGEFESRMTALIADIKASKKPLVLFIDEAHMLIGAGNQSGAADAANLLKPALARGELRTIAATTWVEYKKYFEKDAALRRRFQMVKVDEPSRATAISMLTQLKPRYESGHGVYIRQAAIEAAVDLSSRYIASRQLPDKAVELLDRCGAYVRLRQSYRPETLGAMERKVKLLESEQTARRRDRLLAGEGTADDAELAELGQQIERLRIELRAEESRYEREKQTYEKVVQLRQEVEVAGAAGTAEQHVQLHQACQQLKELQADAALIPVEVDEDVVAVVVAEETGVPIGRLKNTEASKLERLEQHLEERVKGQRSSLTVIANRIRSARMELQDPKRPVGVFLLVGPSGTGKTETALAVADALFGGEQFITTINMSEYMEEHAVSRLIGAPPGYVGYEEGGVLSDAVRQRPYSVVLLDEVEKAKRQILNLFYQVFDRGALKDGQGRPVDFRNTVIFMTSNLGTELTMELCEHGARQPPLAELQERLMSSVLRPYFSPALLARMTVLPYYPLGVDVLRQVLDSKLAQVAGALQARYRLTVAFSPRVGGHLLARCKDVDSGARVLEHQIREELVPRLTGYVMNHLSGGLGRSAGVFVDIGVDADAGSGGFVVGPASNSLTK